MIEAFEQLVYRPSKVEAPRFPVAPDSFAQQWKYVTSIARLNAVCCSRRAGKTVGARLRARLVLGTKPGARVHYVTLIRRNCRKLFWQPLLDELENDGWDVSKANGTDLILPLENGSWIQAMSADDMRDLRSIRGDRSDLFLIDECQEPNDDVLEALVTKIAVPMLMDTAGCLDLLGTVPEVEPCFFSDALDSAEWQPHTWTVFDNPHMDPATVKETAAKAGLIPGHPVYEREIMGRRVKDPRKQAYEYDRDVNDYDPQDVDWTSGVWRHALGLDLGFQDADAIVVVAWDRHDPDRRLYVRHLWQQNHTDVDELSSVLKSVIDKYKPSYCVGDHGGHGAVKVLETLTARLGVRFETKPNDVMVSVGLLNDDLRSRRLLIPRGSQLAYELPQVQRTENQNTKKVEINKRGLHSDLSEALRYAHHAARHWASKAAKSEESIDQRRDRQMREQRTREARQWQ